MESKKVARRQVNMLMDPVLEKNLQQYADERGMNLTEAARTILRLHLEGCVTR